MAGKNKTKKDNKGRRLKDGEGQRKDDGRYYYRWTDNTGKRHTVTNADLQKLREEEKQIQQDIAQGINYANRNMTFVEACETWLELKAGIKPSTKEVYLGAYLNHIKPYFHKKKIVDIKRTTVKKFYHYLQHTKMLSVSTIEIIHTILKQTLETARADRMILDNPAEGALSELVKQKKQEEKHIHALTADQQEEFFSYIKDHPKFARWEPLYSFLLETGVRIGEAIGLQWSDVDFENEVIHINNTLLHITEYELNGNKTSRTAIQTPKSRKSKRVIPLTSAARAALEREQNFQCASGKKCVGTVDGYNNFIFCNSRQGNLSASLSDQHLRNIVKEHNKGLADNSISLPHITNHTFRHTFATRMVEKGMYPKALQDIMGHETLEMTMNVYAKTSVDYLKKEMERVQDSAPISAPISAPKQGKITPIFDNIYQLPIA